MITTWLISRNVYYLVIRTLQNCIYPCCYLPNRACIYPWSLGLWSIYLIWTRFPRFSNKAFIFTADLGYHCVGLENAPFTDNKWQLLGLRWITTCFSGFISKTSSNSSCYERDSLMRSSHLGLHNYLGLPKFLIYHDINKYFPIGKQSLNLLKRMSVPCSIFTQGGKVYSYKQYTHYQYFIL
jgi:hypothetical protein